MSKNNSTVKKQSASRNALPIIIQELTILDSEKAKLFEDLRNLGITDDNDPLVKFTMLQGIFAKYTGETVEKLIHESECLEDTMLSNEGIAERFSNDLQEFKDSIKVWNNEVIIRTQGIIDRLQNDEKKLQDKIKKEQEELYSLKREYDEIKTSCTAIPIIIGLVCIVSILITVIVHAIVWGSGSEEDSKTVEYRDTVENCKPTLKVVDNQSKRDREYNRKLKEIEEIKKSIKSNNNDSEGDIMKQIEKSREILQKILELDKEES